MAAMATVLPMRRIYNSKEFQPSELPSTAMDGKSIDKKTGYAILEFLNSIKTSDNAENVDVAYQVSLFDNLTNKGCIFIV